LTSRQKKVWVCDGNSGIKYTIRIAAHSRVSFRAGQARVPGVESLEDLAALADEIFLNRGYRRKTRKNAGPWSVERIMACERAKPERHQVIFRKFAQKRLGQITPLAPSYQ
jgi:hypothetical protein